MDARLILRGLLLAGSLLAGTPASGFDHSHQAWDALLRKHVAVLEGGKASQLRYAGMAKDRPALTAYLESLSSTEEREFAGWTKPQQMAFLINAYNAFTVEKVLTRYPDLQSIWDFGKLFGNPFKDRFFKLFGRPFSLDEIEHERLRKVFRDPRIHFAVNCASVGCPMLREEAYVGEHLERQLNEQVARFLSDATRNRAANGRLEISKIFDWFGEDFEPRAAYFARHAQWIAGDEDSRRRVAEGRAPLDFLTYDWALNDVVRDARK